MEEWWLSMKDFSGYSGVRRETSYGWIEINGMLGHRVGSSWKFKRDEDDAWAKSDKAAESE